MHANRQTAAAKNKKRITASKVIRWSGIAAMGSGILFIAIQAIHPLDVITSVRTTQWAVAHYMGIAMGFLGLLGITGLYARQVEESGRLGLVAYLLLGLFYSLTTAFQFVEAFITPLLVTGAPAFVESFLGIVTNAPSEMNLGALPLLNQLNGFVGYMLGGLLFGIATFRAGVLPRWAGGLLAFGTVLPLLASSLVAHPYDRIFAVPVGLALAWMGYALLSERQEPASQTISAVEGAQTRQIEAR